MKHHEAIAHLPDFAVDTLDPERRKAVASHVNRCEACRSWLEIHVLLAGVLNETSRCGHLESNLLAQIAASPQDDPGVLHPVLEAHLETCETCREDLDLVRSAVRAARPDSELTEEPSPPGFMSTWWKVAAAAVVGMGIGSLLTVAGFDVTHREAGPAGTVFRSDEAVDNKSSEDEEEIKGTIIAGDRLIVAEKAVTLTQVKIADGANVVIRAGKGVAFGNGFQIRSGARMEVETGSREKPQVKEALGPS